MLLIRYPVAGTVFCGAFIPCPTVYVSFVRLTYPCPTVLWVLFMMYVRTRSAGMPLKKYPIASTSFCKPPVPYPTSFVISVGLSSNTRQLCNFCKTFIPVPDISVSSVRNPVHYKTYPYPIEHNLGLVYSDLTFSTHRHMGCVCPLAGVSHTLP
ncbi:unnamed protein product [Sphacelaria rigidula]